MNLAVGFATYMLLGLGHTYSSIGTFPVDSHPTATSTGNKTPEMLKPQEEERVSILRYGLALSRCYTTDCTTDCNRTKER